MKILHAYHSWFHPYSLSSKSPLKKTEELKQRLCRASFAANAGIASDTQKFINGNRQWTF